MRTGAGRIQHAIGALWKRFGPCVPEMAERVLGVFAWSPASLSRAWGFFRGLPAGKKSLRLRLSIFFAAFLVVAWLCTAVAAWIECREYINEFFDTQQMLFAERLAETHFAHDAAVLSRLKERQPGINKRARGDLEDDALGFAVFTMTGDVVMADAGSGRYFTFKPDKRGFSDERLSGGEGETP